MPLTIFVLSRAAVFVVAGFSLLVDAHLHDYQPPVGSNLVVQGLTRWDGGWFIRVATDGYADPINSNFFPLFPLAGRCISWMTGLSIAASLVLCANVCSAGALVLVYRIFLELEGEPAATASLGLLVAWPFAFFQAAAYPESIMMLCTAGAIYLAMRGRHLGAGTVLGIGILARHLTALAGFVLLVQQIRERGIRPRRLILHRDFIGLILPLLIASIYFGFLAWRFGDCMVWLRMRSKWGNSALWGLQDFFAQSTVRTPANILYVILSIIPGVGAIFLLTRARWRMLAAFGLGLMILLWSVGIAGLGRYSASCWPAFLPIGVMLVKRPSFLVGAICAMVLIQGMLLYLFVHLFPIL